MKHWILSREGSLSIILVIWLFNSCVLKLKYASLVDIFKNYFSCFKDKEGHLLIAPLLNYLILPIILAGIKSNQRNDPKYFNCINFHFNIHVICTFDNHHPDES